jgi:hypothetical protein
VALPDFFSNKKATDEEKSAIEAPTLSLTKVQATIGTLIAAIGAAGSQLHGPTAVKVAAIGGGALVMLGVLGLAAVDLIVRQRAETAKLRWGDGKSASGSGPQGGGGGGGGGGTKILVPDVNHLVLQTKHSSKEYDLLVAELDGDKVTLVAHDGENLLKPTFEPRA